MISPLRYAANATEVACRRQDRIHSSARRAIHEECTDHCQNARIQARVTERAHVRFHQSSGKGGRTKGEASGVRHPSRFCTSYQVLHEYSDMLSFAQHIDQTCLRRLSQQLDVSSCWERDDLWMIV